MAPGRTADSAHAFDDLLANNAIFAEHSISRDSTGSPTPAC